MRLAEDPQRVESTRAVIADSQLSIRRYGGDGQDEILGQPIAIERRRTPWNNPTQSHET